MRDCHEAQDVGVHVNYDRWLLSEDVPYANCIVVAARHDQRPVVCIHESNGVHLSPMSS
jgi:hypothetical protein